MKMMAMIDHGFTRLNASSGYQSVPAIASQMVSRSWYG
jgi:hypothetical protein